MISPTTMLVNAHFPTAGLLDPQGLLEGFGPWAFAAVVAIIFIECGLLVGLILPGDSLLFITGMLIATGFIEINPVLAISVITAAAIVGNLVGYWVGLKIGPALFKRPDSKIFKQEYVTRTHDFFEKFGPRALILARFTPIVRTLITATAGIAKMNFRTFSIYSAIGGVLWTVSMTLLGYYLGTVTFIAENIETLTIAIVLVSVVPIIWELRKSKKN